MTNRSLVHLRAWLLEEIESPKTAESEDTLAWKNKGAFFRERYLFRSGQERGTFFGVFQASQAQKKLTFSMFSKPFKPQKGTSSVFSKPLKPKKGTFFDPDRKRYLFRCFPSLSSPKKVPFSLRTFFDVFQDSQAQKKYFFGVFQASQAQKRYLFRSGPEKGTLVPFSVFSKPLTQAPDNKKRYLFVCFPRLSSPKTLPVSFRTGRRYLFLCFPSLSSAKKVRFSFQTGKRYLFLCFPSLSSPKKVPFSLRTFFDVFQASQAQKTVPFFVPDRENVHFSCFPSLSSTKKVPLKAPFFSVFQASHARFRSGTFVGIFQASQAPNLFRFRKKVPFSVFSKPLKHKKQYLFRSVPEKGSFPSLSSPTMVRVSFRTGTRYPQAQKKYLFRSGPEKKYFFRKHLKSRKGAFFSFRTEKSTFFGVFQASSPKKYFFRSGPEKSEKSLSQAPKKYLLRCGKENGTFFRCFPSLQKKYPFCFGPTFFRLFQASQAKKRYFPAFSKPLKSKKGTFFVPEKVSKPLKPKKGTFFGVFQASQAQKERYLFLCSPSLSSPNKVPFSVFSGPEKIPFSVFSKPLKPKKIPFSFRACQASQVKKGTFFVPDLKKVPFSVFSKPLKRKKNTFFVPDRKKVPISVF